MGNEPTITITKEEYKKLVRSDLLLSALYEEGVDNWEGYGMALFTAMQNLLDRVQYEV